MNKNQSKVNNNIKNNANNKVVNNVNNVNKQINKINNNSNKLNNNLNKINNNKNKLLNISTELLDESLNNLNTLNNNISRIQAEVEAGNNNTNTVPFYVRYKTQLIVIGVLILLIMAYYGGSYVYNKYFKKSKAESQKLFIGNAESSTQTTISNDEIVSPKNGFDFSISTWVYIDDLYQYNTKWRHILHKGPYSTRDVIDFDDWDELTAVHREQNPGLWLHPDKPTLRYVLTIKPSKEFCGMFKNKNMCNERTYCNWEGNVCNLEKLHPMDLFNEPSIDYIDTQEGDFVLQYVDIDVPVNEIHHIAFVLDQKTLHVFQNGKLTQTAKFMGDPVFNKNDLHLFAKNNFSGNILNFNYFPDTISREKVVELSKQLPDFDKVPKKRIAEQHMNNGNIIKAGLSLF